MHLLFVANYPSNTGYAWDTIEAVFRAVGERLVGEGHRVSVCYASLSGGPPESMRGAPFTCVAFDYLGIRTPAAALRFARMLRRMRVDALYLTDRPTWSWSYPLYRLAGIRHLYVHDRTSGERSRPGRLTAGLKRLLHRLPLLSADRFIGVSDFVRRRLVEVAGTPPERTVCVLNGIAMAAFAAPRPGALHRAAGLDPSVPVVFCSGRASVFKGIHVALEAVAQLRDQGRHRVALVYCGAGPYLAELEARVAALGLEEVRFLGRRGDIPLLLGSATIAVVPSLWAEAFGLTVVEAMAAGVPVVATRTGGIPELIAHGRTGLLVEPGDPAALAHAIGRLLEDPAERAAMAREARAEVARRFTLERVAGDLHAQIATRLTPGRRPGLARPRPDPGPARS